MVSILNLIMSKIKIKNFGPIKEGYQNNDGYIDIKKVSLFIGNQGSGKSVVAKIISTFSWIEKALVRGDYDVRYFERKNKLRNQYLAYHRLENYFSKSNNEEETIIDYKGDAFHIKFENGTLQIEDAKNGDYPLPQILYVPAERNFIANVRSPRVLKLISPSLAEFVTEFDNAKQAIKGPMLLPINNDVYVEYNKSNDIVFIRGKDYRINLTEASSGFQSLVPLYLVSWFLSNSVRQADGNIREQMSSEQRERFRERFRSINENSDLTEELKRVAISELAKEFTKTAFINIVEEAEQNLYPTSQRGMLNTLLEFNNINQGNKLILTTHSPYIINYLSLAIQGSTLRDKISGSSKEKDLLAKLNNVIPETSLVSPDDVAIYQLNEVDGSITKLSSYEGIPSDKNYLNMMIREGNQLFDSLLEIEEEL